MRHAIRSPSPTGAFVASPPKDAVEADARSSSGCPPPAVRGSFSGNQSGRRDDGGSGHAGWRYLLGAVVELRRSLRVYFCESQQHISAPTSEHRESQRLPALPWALKRYFFTRGAADERGSSGTGDFFAGRREKRTPWKTGAVVAAGANKQNLLFFFFTHAQNASASYFSQSFFWQAPSAQNKERIFPRACVFSLSWRVPRKKCMEFFFYAKVKGASLYGKSSPKCSVSGPDQMLLNGKVGSVLGNFLRLARGLCRNHFCIANFQKLVLTFQ